MLNRRSDMHAANFEHPCGRMRLRSKNIASDTEEILKENKYQNETKVAKRVLQSTLNESAKRSKVSVPVTPTKTKGFVVQNANKSNLTSTPSSILQQAKSAFRRCATPSRLVGRKVERENLTEFIKNHINNQMCGSLYISG